MTRVLLVYPKIAVSDYTAQRMWESVNRYFAGDAFAKRRAAPSQSRDHYRRAVGEDVADLSPNLLAEHDIIVLAASLLHECRVPEGKRVYHIRHDHAAVNIRLHNQAISAIDWPHLDAHSFNRLGSPRTLEQFEFFPFGVTFRECIGAAPNNEFGFRVEEDVDSLASRGPDERVIVVLGGSAAWSWYNFHEETFSYVLQQRLQATLHAAGRPERVHVLNFGQGGAAILHEAIVYLLHCEPLCPDIVISHDGFNDLLWGLTADPYLLERRICAPYILEDWARRLHGPEGAGLRFRPGEELQPINRPRSIIDAYLDRKTQLARLTRAGGARHIFALQPWILSKGGLSDIERDYLAEMRRSDSLKRLYERIPFLYRNLAERLTEIGDVDLLDFHSGFARFDAAETLFQDAMHTTPLGDQKIAGFYHDHIIANGLLDESRR